MVPKIFIRDMLYEYLPVFCWQTRNEILLMLEQIDEDINEMSLNSIICELVREGNVEIRANPYNIFGLGKGRRIGTRGFPAQYRKSPKWIRVQRVKTSKRLLVEIDSSFMAL